MAHSLKSETFRLSAICLGALAVSACGSPKIAPQHAAVVTLYIDISRSMPLIDNPAFAERVIEQVGREVRDLELGDEVRVFVVGNRTADRAVSLPKISTGYNLRIPEAATRVQKNMRDLIAEHRQDGGDDATNLLFALENSHPICTPRSRVILISDGIEANDSYSVVRALANGTDISLPKAQQPYLKGCSVTFYGMGISSETGAGIEAQPLANSPMQALTNAWRTYLRSAGVNNDAITIHSMV
jgi:hypothetical protein